MYIYTYICAWTTKLLSEKPTHEFRAIHLTGATQEQQQQLEQPQQQQITANNNNNNNKSINQLYVVNFHALQVREAVGQVYQSPIAQSPARCAFPAGMQSPNGQEFDLMSCTCHII